jgi:hypothetical protein
MFTATDHVYQKGNMADLNKDGSLNGRLIVDTDFIKKGATLTDKRQHKPTIGISIDSPEDAYAKVVRSAGSSLQRDAVDERLIGYVKTLGTEGKIFKNEQDAGGQQELKTAMAKQDSDGDGIPDEWEKANKLNASDKKDANKITKSGYSNLEIYLNSLGK